MDINKLLSSLFHEHNIQAKFENDIVYETELCSQTITFPYELNCSFIESSDILTITVTVGDSNPVSFYSSSTDYSFFKTQLSTELEYQDNSIINATVKIDKMKVSKCIHVYDYDAFLNTVCNLALSEVFTVFDRVLRDDLFINFIVHSQDISFSTDTIHFTPKGGAFKPNHSYDRLATIEKLKTVSYFTNFETFRLVPEDFNVVDNYNDGKLAELFNSYKIILSIIYLFDVTTLKSSELLYKINGYKSINGKLSAFNTIKNGDEYFGIYKWVFTGGNINDKIGLARNIISLNLINKNRLDLREATFFSIQSSYKIYEKQNIKQYIEIRNKISDQLIDFNTRANKIVEGFAGNFQKSALTLVTFYSSTIIIKVLSKGNFTGIFTFDTTILSIAFLVISVIYFFISRWEALQLKERYKSSYKNLKERYTDLLDNPDIQRILNNDTEYNLDLEFINSKLVRYSFMWILFLSIIFFVTLVLYLSHYISELYKHYLFYLEIMELLF